MLHSTRWEWGECGRCWRPTGGATPSPRWCSIAGLLLNLCPISLLRQNLPLSHAGLHRDLPQHAGPYGPHEGALQAKPLLQVSPTGPCPHPVPPCHLPADTSHGVTYPGAPSSSQIAPSTWAPTFADPPPTTTISAAEPRGRGCQGWGDDAEGSVALTLPPRPRRCENCMLRFRTHRSLFKHLHVCSDSASNPAPPPKADKPVLPATSALEKEPPAKPPEGLPKLPSVIRPPEKEAILPGADSAPAAPAVLPTSLPELPGSLEALPLVSPAPHPFPLLEPSLFGPSSLTRFSGPPPSSVPGPFLSYVHPSPYSLPQPPAQHRLRPYVPGHGPPISNAVWKKSQGVSVSPLLPCFGSGVTPGHSSNSRIVWEHTRGRYTCMQCPYSTASREEMTLHIEDHRKNPPPPGRLDTEMDFGVGLASFHAKLTPEMENSLYSQL
uniref:Zinc finger protein 414 n=1 Tax=Accipiter nisus TaxID=211598 RepID=A0A8B9NJB5_9AVES